MVRRHWKLTVNLQSVPKLVGTLPLKGPLQCFANSKKVLKIKLYLPLPFHAMLCNCLNYL